MRSASGAIKYMSTHKEARSGWCLSTVQSAFDASHLYPNAASAWHSQTGKHHGDKPPRGGVVYWTGGSHGYGHIAIALGDDMILSTDLPNWGSIGRVHLHTPRTSWGLHYVGWTDHMNGVPIQGLGHHGTRPDVYVSKLHYGQRHSRSVKELQKRLNKVLHLEQSHSKLHVDGHYSAHTDHAVIRWKKRKGYTRGTTPHRSFIGPKQAKRLFPSKKYDLHHG